MKAALKRKKVGILSLGCSRNLVDSETILSRLSLKGYRLVDLKEADVAIVNTCGFIKEAKEESITEILDLLELKKKGRLKKIIVYGCLVERYAKELRAQFKGVDAFVGRVSLNHTRRNLYLTPRHYAYLKICEGCLNRCSFCVIPQIKGEFSSRDPAALIKEVKILEERGIKELNIIGQDITLYGRDLPGRVSLTGVLKQIIKNTKNIPWFRLLYLSPERINAELLDLIKNEPRICKYIDLPLQHINNRILKLMRRNTRKDEILKLISKIRKKIPQVALRTTLMVGFPTETEREFRELCAFVEAARFEKLGVFLYSREEGTAAYNFSPQVDYRVKQARLQEVMLRQQEISRELNYRFLNKTLDVLVDESDDGQCLGRSAYDAPEVDGTVFIKSKKAIPIGKMLSVKVIDTLEYDLVGEIR